MKSKKVDIGIESGGETTIARMELTALTVQVKMEQSSGKQLSRCCDI